MTILTNLLASQSTAFDMLMPILEGAPYPAPNSSPGQSLLRFSLGLSMDSKTRGWLAAGQATFLIPCQLILFPLVARKIGTLQPLCLSLTIWPALYFVFPYVASYISRPVTQQIPVLLVVLFFKSLLQAMTFPAVSIELNNTVQSPLVAGIINGSGATAAAFGRSVGMIAMGRVNTWGAGVGIGGLAWWMDGFVSAVAAIASWFIGHGPDDERGQHDGDRNRGQMEARCATALVVEDNLEDGRQVGVEDPLLQGMGRGACDTIGHGYGSADCEDSRERGAILFAADL